MSPEVAALQQKVEGLERELRSLRAVADRALALHDDFPDMPAARSSSVRWPGVAYINGRRFYDPALTADHEGTEIVGPASTYIRCQVGGGGAVSYNSGPRPAGGFPPEEEWYETALQSGPIHITRFG